MKSSAYQTAINYLARREHSRGELTQKLKLKGFSPEEIETTLNQLIQTKLQSNHRFAESFINSRRRKGYGPIRISNELQERGLTAEEIAEALDITDNSWFSDALQAWKKRFRSQKPSDFQERAKQMRFLQYRGFTQEQINAVFERSR